MRKAQKKQAEDFAELLGQAHEEIRRSIEKKNIPAALGLLADCQEGAISLGNLVENMEGVDTPAIAVLEAYCEQLYHIHERLVESEGSRTALPNVNKVYKRLRHSLFQIKSCIDEIKVRREAVFLPYKASMWDSLESVWKAAAEDPDCDVYVIPIPYYDRNPDGTFREMHYEGDQYPEYVPVTWYEDYDFRNRKPDLIFIHNPYDEFNYVTSVHPYFYTTNLKKFTNQLVYIPYFILGDFEPDNEEALEGIKHFCTVPGVINADRVIVQSEKMRQAYINILTKLMAGHGNGREYWEKKILGLGSPKIDKVLDIRKEELEIPEEWMKIIRKPDGSWKKIVFYNTCVAALLEKEGQMLEKMKDVFRIFRENAGDVALLWRPHPLIQATIESMRPKLWEGYRQLVQEYRKAGWGIYDDTADVDRAIILSDAYYGDWSSVVQLYQATGKPVMIQNVEAQQGS